MKNSIGMLALGVLVMIWSSCGDGARIKTVPSAEKNIQFEEIITPSSATVVQSDKVEVNGFVISNAKFNRVDEEGTRYFVINGEDREFYCGHSKLTLGDMKMGDATSFNDLISKRSVVVPETSPIWIFLGGAEKVSYAQNSSCYIFPQDFGAVGGSLVLISKDDGEVVTLNYSKPVTDVPLVVSWFVRHASKP